MKIFSFNCIRFLQRTLVVLLVALLVVVLPTAGLAASSDDVASLRKKQSDLSKQIREARSILNGNPEKISNTEIQLQSLKEKLEKLEKDKPGLLERIRGTEKAEEYKKKETVLIVKIDKHKDDLKRLRTELANNTQELTELLQSKQEVDEKLDAIQGGVSLVPFIVALVLAGLAGGAFWKYRAGKSYDGGQTEEVSVRIIGFMGSQFENTHENKAFDKLYDELKRAWRTSGDLVAVLGNFRIWNKQIDALVIMPNSITVIDFKHDGGDILFSESESWTIDGRPLGGGSKVNPFVQIRDNRFVLKDYLEKQEIFKQGGPDFYHISGLVLFDKPVSFDDSKVLPKVSKWFYICDFDNVARVLSQIASGRINLTDEQIRAIPNMLSIPEYEPV